VYFVKPILRNWSNNFSPNPFRLFLRLFGFSHQRINKKENCKSFKSRFLHTSHSLFIFCPLHRLHVRYLVKDSPIKGKGKKEDSVLGFSSCLVLLI
jgi:hypothetical protein